MYCGIDQSTYINFETSLQRESRIHTLHTEKMESFGSYLSVVLSSHFYVVFVEKLFAK